MPHRQSNKTKTHIANVKKKETSGERWQNQLSLHKCKWKCIQQLFLHTNTHTRRLVNMQNVCANCVLVNNFNILCGRPGVWAMCPAGRKCCANSCGQPNRWIIYIIYRKLFSIQFTPLKYVGVFRETTY